MMNEMTMRQSRRAFLAGAAAFAGNLAGPGAIRTARAQGKDMLRFALSSYPSSLRPFQHAGTSAGAVKLMIHRGLVGYDAAGKLRGEVAESFRADGERAYVFELRENARFHNGDRVTGEDVKFTIEQIAGAKSTAYLKAAYEIVDQVEVKGRSVRILLKAPSATFPFHLASFNAPIISAKSSDAEAIGCGPYRITEIERGTRMDLAAFDGYFRPGFPKTPKLRCIAYADENLRVAALQAGDVDLIEYVPWQSMAAIGANPALKLDATDGPFMGLVFNTRQGPFANPKLRQAVAYAVNRADVVKAAFFGHGTPMEGLPIVPNSPFYDAAREAHWKQDIARAKQLLAEAGMPDGFQTSLLSSAQYGMHKDTAEVVQQSLAAVGIRATLQLPDYSTRLQLGNRGQYELAVVGYALDYEDPDAMSSFLAGSSPSYQRSFGFENKAITDLLAKGRAELDLAARKTIYDEMIRLALAEAPMVGLAWRSQGYAFRREVSGFRSLPGSLSFYSPVTIEEASLV
jgi:ABC-type transport system substrate-binding protein